MPIHTAVWADSPSAPPEVIAEHDAAADAIRVALHEPGDRSNAICVYLNPTTAVSLWRQLGEIPEVVDAAPAIGSTR